MSRSSTLRGQSIVLTAIFLDAGGDPVAATGLSVSLFPPGHDPRLGADEDDAWVWRATTSTPGTGPYASDEVIESAGAGYYQYTFTVPVDADFGTAFDNWIGVVDSQTLDETFAFVIVGGGSIETSVIHNNNVVFVRLDETIASTDGVELGEDFEWFFTTEYNPMYSSARRVRLDIGPLIADIPDDTVNFAIFEASLQADALTFGTTSGLDANSLRFFAWARRQYVTCLAELTLLSAVAGGAGSNGGGGKSKRLADLDVSYSAASLGDMEAAWKRAQDCVLKWQAVVTSVGVLAPGTSHKAQMVIKGEYDPDRPVIGRGWETTENMYDLESQVPASNTRTRYLTRRRWQSDYRNRGRFSGGRFGKEYE